MSSQFLRHSLRILSRQMLNSRGDNPQECRRLFKGQKGWDSLFPCFTHALLSIYNSFMIHIIVLLWCWSRIVTLALSIALISRLSFFPIYICVYSYVRRIYYKSSNRAACTNKATSAIIYRIIKSSNYFVLVSDPSLFRSPATISCCRYLIWSNCWPKTSHRTSPSSG
jgi:hypothetical protein